MNIFENLPPDKKQRVINSAMHHFAAYGYKKASVSDIARGAGISKAMIFTYFGSKSRCYEYMCDKMFEISMEKYDEIKDKVFEVTDCFERMKYFAMLKIEIVKHCPDLLSFGVAMYKETHPDIRQKITEIMSKSYHLAEILTSENIDTTKLKNPADAENIKHILRWIAYGCAEEWVTFGTQNIDEALKTYMKCLDTLRDCFYK